MEAAKLAIAKFTARKGHKTYVEESVRPAITRETVKPTRHEILTEAIDKEVHAHHYHTTIQPLSHREVLPTKHTHNLIPVAKRDFTHETEEINRRTKDAHAAELLLFANHSETLPVVHTKSAKPAVIGEHVHHHVHEIVQPIVFKETIAPEVVHTTIPIHERHHNEPIHHPMSELAHISYKDFMGLSKPAKATESYEGAPRPYNQKLLVDKSKLKHKPAAIDTSTPRKSTVTPPLSPASAASSASMPSTPKHYNSAEPGFRNSEDVSQEFSLGASPTKTPTKGQTVPADPSQNQSRLYY